MKIPKLELKEKILVALVLLLSFDRFRMRIKKLYEKLFKSNINFNLPEELDEYFEYLKSNYNVDKNKYCKYIIKNEIFSRNSDLNIF